MTNEELIYLYQNGDKEALASIVEQNKGIVYKMANKCYVGKTNSIEIDDLEQEGFTGLIVAATKYDLNNPKKALFITYALYWIRQKIYRFIYNKNTNEETSLNAPTNKEGDNELSDYIEGVDYSFENIEDKIYIKEIHKELDQVMNEHTSLKEREILKMHYGWNNSNYMSLQDIGDIFGVTKQMIGNIERVAYRKIRKSPWYRAKVIAKISSSERVSYAEKYFM